MFDCVKYQEFCRDTVVTCPGAASGVPPSVPTPPTYPSTGSMGREPGL